MTTKMKTLFYTSKASKEKEKFKIDIQHQIPFILIETVSSIYQLQKSLMRPLNRISAAVLWISHHSELTYLIELLPYFDNIRIILILPDRAPENMTLALQLMPSFISYAGNDLEDITSVLKKINRKVS